MKTLLLLEQLPIGEKFHLVSVDDSTARDLLAKRVALMDTPTVRKRFGDLIKTSASAE